MGNRFSYQILRDKGFSHDNGVFTKKPLTTTEIKRNSAKKLIVQPAIAEEEINSIVLDNYRPHITLNINPMRKPRMTEGDKANYRPETKRYWNYKSQLNREAIEKSYYKVSDVLDIEFHIAMPKSWSKKDKEKMNGKPHQEMPDIDNLCKAFFDCLKKQDKTIWAVNKKKYWAYEGKIVIYI